MPNSVQRRNLLKSAAGVAGDPLLQLDHLGPQFAEHQRTHRALLPDGPVDHANAVERQGRVVHSGFLHAVAHCRRSRTICRRPRFSTPCRLIESDE